MRRMNTRSTSKHEPYLILNDDRKTAREWDDSFKSDSMSETDSTYQADMLVQQHLCGWACECLLTRLNALIAVACFTIVFYTLSETTMMFENLSALFTNKPVPAHLGQNKTFERFLESHFFYICMAGPLLLAAFVISSNASKYQHRIKACSCPKVRQSSRQSPTAQEMQLLLDDLEETEKEQARKDKIRNRKKTPANKDNRSRSPKKSRTGRSKSKSPKKDSKKKQGPRRTKTAQI